MSRLLISAMKAGFKMKNKPVPVRKTELSNKFGGTTAAGSSAITSAGVNRASIRAVRTDDVPGYVNRNQHITDQIRYEGSARARAMLTESTNSFEGNIIADTRIERLKNTTTKNNPHWEHDNESSSNLGDNMYTLGHYKTSENKINVFNPLDSWVSKEKQISTLHHEASHAGDVVPWNWVPPAGISPESIHSRQAIGYGNVLMPKNDILRINKLASPHSSETKWGRYITNPTEVRARLNQIRTNLLNNEVDIYNEKVTKKDLEKAKNTTAYKNLKDYFGDDGIFEMINTIATKDNNKDNNKNLA